MRSSPLDWLIIGLYLSAILLIGWWKGREERTTKDFIGGGHNMPAWAVLGSIIATEISALTFLNVPGVAFTGNLTYLQFGLGTIAGRFVVAYLFLSAFYRRRYLTVYSYLADRFGPRTRYAATALFLFTRLLGSSLRLSLAALGVSIIFDLPFLVTLILFSLLAVAYTFWGGIKAIVWTDVVQTTVFIGGGIALAVWLGAEVGWIRIWERASESGKTLLINLSPEEPGVGAWLNGTSLLPLAFLNGFLMIIAALGTDQDLTQRMLTCRNVGDARRSTILSGFVGIPVAALFLCLGLGLFVYAQETTSWILPLSADGSVDANRVFPGFISEIAPPLLRGLLIAGVFAAAMSSLDSAMGALSSSVVIDLYKPLIRPDASERHYLRASRLGVLVFGVILACLAYGFRNAETFLWLAFELASIPAGALLGVFLLGLLTSRGSDNGNLLGLGSGVALTAFLAVARRTEWINLDWTWLIVIGMSTSFLLGLLFKPPPVEPAT